MIVKLLTEHHLEFLSLKGGCRGSSESHMSKCHIVGNLISRLNYVMRTSVFSDNNTRLVILKFEQVHLTT